jgi:hypothetical protein
MEVSIQTAVWWQVNPRSCVVENCYHDPKVQCYSEDGGSRLLRNIGSHLPYYKELPPKRL